MYSFPSTISVNSRYSFSLCLKSKPSANSQIGLTVRQTSCTRFSKTILFASQLIISAEHSSAKSNANNLFYSSCCIYDTMITNYITIAIISGSIMTTFYV